MAGKSLTLLYKQASIHRIHMNRTNFPSRKNQRRKDAVERWKKHWKGKETPKNVQKHIEDTEKKTT
jgi:hypothetical protein